VPTKESEKRGFHPVRKQHIEKCRIDIKSRIV